MKLNYGLHLAYCTNVHPGETWEQTFDSLNRHTLSVKSQLGDPAPYAIGLRLSDVAARQLAEPQQLGQFKTWLERHGCYVFTINGFPFGRFHGARVKEQVYLPDWSSPARLDYTIRLFDLLAELLPPGIEGSVSTLPGSFKEFIHTEDQVRQIRTNLWQCVEHVARLSERTGKLLHLGLEPEPLGLFENTAETLDFFESVRREHPGDPRLALHLGVNYDTCHFAIQFEEPGEALAQFRARGIRLSKIHLSNALRLHPSPESTARLAGFTEDIYLHQVIARASDGGLRRFKDLPLALSHPQEASSGPGEEWRVHFHVPLHCQAPAGLDSTAGHVQGLLDCLSAEPRLCTHLEMETYTWAVLPLELRSRDVSEQLVSEYRWTLDQCAHRGLWSR